MKYDDRNVVFNDVRGEITRSYFKMKDESEIEGRALVDKAEAYLVEADNIDEIGRKLYPLANYTRDAYSFMVGWISHAKMILLLNEDVNQPVISIDSEAVDEEEAVKYMAEVVKRKAQEQLVMANKVLAKLNDA